MKQALTFLLAMSTLLLVGCASLPSWDDVRDEARGEMQAVVDILPEGSVDRVEDPRPMSRFSCDGGAMYTGQRHVYLVGSPDVLSYLADMRARAVICRSALSEHAATLQRCHGSLSPP